MLTPPRLLALLSATMLLFSPAIAQAYTGPGIGLGALGVAFGLVGSLFLAIASVLWYPVKRMIRRARGVAKQR
jgi:hypothetical protein